jgi:hypothetical protein
MVAIIFFADCKYSSLNAKGEDPLESTPLPKHNKIGFQPIRISGLTIVSIWGFHCYLTNYDNTISLLTILNKSFNNANSQNLFVYQKD